MEDGSRVPAGDDPSYWLDACEDISCDFIDFDVSSIVSEQPDNPSNQDFFGGIDKILDSIKNGAGLPLNHGEPASNSNGTAAGAGEVWLPSNATLADGGNRHPHTPVPASADAAFDHSATVRNNGSSKLSNGNEGGVLVNYSKDRGVLNGGHDVDSEERCSKRARLGGYKNERPHYGRGNYQGKERERCFNNNRKRPRDRDEVDRRDRDGGGRKREHCGAVGRRDVRDRDWRDREPRGYWERDKSGNNDMVFRPGAWEPERNREEKMVNDVKQESNGKLDKKSEEAKERVPEEKARQYQLDVLDQAKRKNTIAFLETGAGKTLIAVLLIKSIQESLQKQNKKMLAVFLVPKVPLVYQVK
ncbi:endoribonuclease Dicer homolog 1-like [Vigna umbellata]|uniref:endoribonuclease Dicer homolog 1-like n=1 Tax=Vigna umbellata TaxID=87088 RepID=UPI001F5FA4DA|nr:endoribonuclease Dicer homolog 1-like [Vigna umbellata]